jgi:hypothetical protein
MSEPIFIQIDDEVVEATGEALQNILDARAEEEARVQAELDKVAAKESAMSKLAKLGLTEDEAKSIVGI